jgi:Zn-dependent protease with chaperone function
VKAALSIFLSLLLAWTGAAPAAATAPPAPAVPAPQEPARAGYTLAELVERPYLELFELAPELTFDSRELRNFRRTLEQRKKDEERRVRGELRELEGQEKAAQDRLKELNRRRESAEVEKYRHDLHCHIQALRERISQKKLVLEKGLDIYYDNRLAKLQILEQWPARRAEIQRMIQTGRDAQRPFGDYRDIGFRGGDFRNQADDIRRGREAIDELKRMGIMPPEVEDEEVVRYVRALGRRIAEHSDLQVPLNVSVLKSKEINAFALPGGFLYVNSGLILKAETEAELAGVIAHEIAHSAARHGHRLMRRATIASIIFQAAQIAAVIFTGGVAGIGTYYALQYGFFGLGLVLSLDLLGVSRDFELEADVLGVQYLWHAGYNTRGFVQFFDRMAQEEGYVTGLSWFRTHPPFYERMAATMEEITFLPAQTEARDDSGEFHAAKSRLAEVMKRMEEQDRDAPTLKRVYECADDEDHSKVMQQPLPPGARLLPHERPALGAASAATLPCPVR